MPTDIGPKIGISGEKKFRDEIKSINTSLKTLGTEMKVVTSEFIGNENTVEALTAKNRQLAETSAALEDKMRILRERLTQYAEAGQLSSESAQRLKQDLNNATAQFNKTEAQIRQNTAAIEELNATQSETGESSDTLSRFLDELGLTFDDVTKKMGISSEQASALSSVLNGGGMSVVAAAAATAAAIALAAEAVKAITKFMTDAVKEGTAYADSILTLSTNFGIATERLQEYQYMAELTDTSLDTITGSISRLTRVMNSARDGSGDAADAFTWLNIRVTDTNGELRDSEDVFNEIIRKLGLMSNETERDAIAQTLLGKSAMELNSLIATGTDGIAAYAEEAHKMGYVLSEEDLQALGSLDDEFQRLSREQESIKNQISAEMAPALIELAHQLLEVAQTVDWRKFGQSAAQIITSLTPLIVNLANAAAGLANALADVMTAAREIFGSNLGASFKGVAKSLSGTNAIGGGIQMAYDLYSLGTSAYQALTSSRASSNRNITLNITSEIDGAVLARNQYRYSAEETDRHGTQAVH